MALTCMTPVLPELIVSRENGWKHADSVTPVRQEPSRFVPTFKALRAVAAPIVLEQADDSGAWVERETVEPAWAQDHADLAMKAAKRIGGSGRFVHRGKVIGYWGSVPKEQQ